MSGGEHTKLVRNRQAVESGYSRQCKDGDGDQQIPGQRGLLLRCQRGIFLKRANAYYI